MRTNLFHVYDMRDFTAKKEVNVHEILENFEVKHGKPPLELIVNMVDTESILEEHTTSPLVLPFHIFLGMEEKDETYISSN